eukprot:361241-Chlamydomonas_euryale.AAC.10
MSASWLSNWTMCHNLLPCCSLAPWIINDGYGYLGHVELATICSGACGDRASPYSCPATLGRGDSFRSFGEALCTAARYISSGFLPFGMSAAMTSPLTVANSKGAQ